MVHRNCSNCGAPLTSQSVDDCEFCGVELVEAPPPVPPAPAVQPFVPVHVFRPSPSPQPSGGAGVVIGLVAVLMVCGGVAAALVMLLSGRPASRSPTLPTVPPEEPGPAASRGVPLAQLHATPLSWTTPVVIDAPGMSGRPERFDPLANWEWALGVGRAWWEDAELFELRVDPIARDGTVDTTTATGHATFKFVSAACKSDQKKRAETEKLDPSSCTLTLSLSKDGLRGRMELIGISDTRNHALAKPPCTIAQAFEALESSKKWTKRPAYAIALVHDVFGLQYRLSSGNGAAAMPGLDLAPTFCGAKGGAAAPRPTLRPSTGGGEAPKEPNLPPFEARAATRALTAMDLSSCRAAGGPTGSGKATLTFANTGQIVGTRFSAPYEGTPTGACIARKFGSVRVPPFNGPSVALPMTFSL